MSQVAPWRTATAAPARRVVMTGTSLARASRMTSPNGSTGSVQARPAYHQPMCKPFIRDQFEQLDEIWNCNCPRILLIERAPGSSFYESAESEMKGLGSGAERRSIPNHAAALFE